jgi:hypothetical protein
MMSRFKRMLLRKFNELDFIFIIILGLSSMGITLLMSGISGLLSQITTRL